MKIENLHNFRYKSIINWLQTKLCELISQNLGGWQTNYQQKKLNVYYFNYYY